MLKKNNRIRPNINSVRVVSPALKGLAYFFLKRFKANPRITRASARTKIRPTPRIISALIVAPEKVAIF